MVNISNLNKKKKLKVQEFTLSQIPQRNLIKKLAIIMFAIFLTEGNEFSFFFFYRHKAEIKIWTHT